MSRAADQVVVVWCAVCKRIIGEVETIGLAEVALGEHRVGVHG